jgi:hypothetical protein
MLHIHLPELLVASILIQFGDQLSFGGYTGKLIMILLFGVMFN